MQEKKIHFVFVISLFLKGLFALTEIIGGIIAYVITFIGNIFPLQQSLYNFVKILVREELTEDPRDFVANQLLHLPQTLSVKTLDFTAFYLLSHGIIKFWLIVGLLRKRLWYYPTAIIVFGLFILYQVYRYSFTHSILLLLITAVDFLVIFLTWHEYKYLHRYEKEKLELAKRS
ncbi:MAG: DUF2127 domain-containing protein [Bacteroidetes bacterium]|nr:MAG: DUF2127 domain-containing protein [Bacteroidota bacterium]